MDRRCRRATRTVLYFRSTVTLLQIAVAALGVLSLWLRQPIEAMGQSTPPIEIDDAASGAGSPPARTLSVSRLSELVNKGQWSGAAELAQEFAQEEPGDAAVRYYLGLALVHLHDSIGAIKALRNAERQGMDTAYLHQALGIAYYNMHQFILFQQQMEKSIALAPADYKPYYYLGHYLESVRNDFPGGRECFVKATRLNPAHTASWYYEGYCLELSGKRTEARTAYDTAIKSMEGGDERFSLPYQGIARLLLDAAPAQALEFAHKAVELEPDLDSNHVIIAKIYERLGRLSEAAEELQTAERLDPNNASPRFMLARIYSQAGNRKAAEAELEAFKRINQIYGSQ